MSSTSPIGRTAVEVAKEAEKDPEYRAEKEQWAATSELATQVMLARGKAGLSQEELAKRVGTSHSAISRLESGRHMPSLKTLQRVAQALGLDLKIELAEQDLSKAA